MSTFEERESAFEAKFAHDATQQFQIEARRNALLGQWAAQILGKSEAEAQAYIKAVVKAEFAQAGDGAVYHKLVQDLEGHVTALQVRDMIEAKAAQARDEITQAK